MNFLCMWLPKSSFHIGWGYMCYRNVFHRISRRCEKFNQQSNSDLFLCGSLALNLVKTCSWKQFLFLPCSVSICFRFGSWRSCLNRSQILFSLRFSWNARSLLISFPSGCCFVVDNWFDKFSLKFFVLVRGQASSNITFSMRRGKKFWVRWKIWLKLRRKLNVSFNFWKFN